MTQPDTLLTAEEVAPKVRRSAETVLRWARQGKIDRVVLPSGRILFRPEAVDALLNGKAAS